MGLPKSPSQIRTITKITETRRGRFALFFDDEFDFSVDPATFALEKIQVGKRYDEEEYENLRHVTQYEAGKERALQLLSYKPYARKMLEDKLLPDYAQESIQEVLDRMESLGLLDDQDYANRCARDLVYIKKYSLYRVKQELRRRGIPNPFIEIALSQFDELSPESQIAALIQKKYLRYLDDEKGRRRTVNGLLRLGYSYQDIHQVIENLLDDPDYYNEDDEEYE